MQKKIENLINSIAPPNTLLFYFLLFFSGVLFLGLFRLGFLLKYHSLASGIPSSILFQSFITGARFDMVVLTYVLTPFFILSSFPAIGLFRFKWGLKIVLSLVFLFLSLLFFLSLVDLEYFSQYGTHLSEWALEYIDRPDVVIFSVWDNYPVVRYLILWALLCSAFIFLVLRVGKNLLKTKSTRPLLNQTLYFLLALSLLFISGRGRVKTAPIDWGLAYFSKYDFANQLALNGAHTLAMTYLEEKSEGSPRYLAEFQFFESKDALNTVQNLLLQKNEKLENPQDSIRRINPFNDSQFKLGSSSKENQEPNVVIIFLESWLAEYVGSYGAKTDATPFFDSLARKSILFENFYASGTRTNRGLLSVLCAFPSQPGGTLMKKYNHNLPFVSLSRILKGRGYETAFVYGGDLMFDNMEGFSRQQGFEHFIGQEDFPPGEYISKWGVPDDIVLSRAVQKFDSFKEKPFLGVIVTLSNHEPFAVPSYMPKPFPPDLPYANYLNAFYYSDWSLGKFFHEAEKEPFFDNTIFVLVADHGKALQSSSDFPLNRFHIAALIYSPKFSKEEPRRIKTIASQTDLVPTILGLLGEPTEHESWGRDILSLSSEDKGFAMMVDGKRIGWLEGPYFLVDRIGATTSLYNYMDDPEQKKDISAEYPEIVRDLQKKERSFLQLSILQSAKKGLKPKNR
jgi:phosphoglycerol transferase MdoB-like AlkP superfamily enzyme